MQWVFLTAFVFGITVWIMNFYPGQYKGRILAPGNTWANNFIYHLAAKNTKEKSVVLLREDGDFGKYNRAHRTLYHFLENCLPVVFALPFALFIYAFPAFVTGTIYCVARLIYQHGYTAYGFKGRVPGFFIERLSMTTITGLCFVAAILTFAA